MNRISVDRSIIQKQIKMSNLFRKGEQNESEKYKNDPFLLDLSNKCRQLILPQVLKHLTANPSLFSSQKYLTVLTDNSTIEFTSIVLDQSELFPTIKPKNILRVLNCCIFPSIMIIQLDKMRLTNCEFLSYMELPNLKLLAIQNNYITSLKPMSKGMLKFMKYLTASTNPITIIEWGRIKLPKSIQFFLLRFYPQKTNCCQSLADLIKLEASYSKGITYSPDKKIPQQSIQMQIQKSSCHLYDVYFKHFLIQSQTFILVILLKYIFLISVSKTISDHDKSLQSKSQMKPLQPIQCKLEITDLSEYPVDCFPQIQAKIKKKILLKIHQDIEIQLRTTYSFVLNYDDRTNPYQITKIFANCTFRNLKLLHINHQQLRNCQFLTFLNAPFLEQLSLINNQFINFKSLSKAYIKLKNLNFQKNYVKECPSYERMQFEKEFKSLRLEYTDKEVQHEDAGILVKMQANFVQKISVWSKDRIEQRKVFNALRERFVLDSEEDGQQKVTLIV